MLRKFYIALALILTGLFIATSCKDNATSPVIKPELFGFIYDSDGTPFNGALVELLNTEEKVLVSQLTDSLGKFSLGNISGDIATYSLRVSAEGYATVIKSTEDYMKGKTTEKVEIQMSKLQEDICCDNIAKFTIKNEEGNPVKGARVFLRRDGVVKYEGTANDNGLAAIDGICKGEYSVLIKYEGYVSQEMAIEFACEQTIEKAITLKKSDDVCCNNVAKFTIKDEEGNPVNGAKVLLRRNGITKYEGTAGDNGLVTIDGICKGEYSVLIKREGFASQEMGIEFDCEQTVEKSIVLKKAEVECCNNNVKFTIKDESGNAVKGAKVYLRIMGVIRYDGTANDDGVLVIDGICKGAYSVLIKYEGFVSQELEVTFSCEQSLEKNVVLKKNDDCCDNIAKFTVKDESGNPVKDAKVYLRRNGAVKYDGVANNDLGIITIDGICNGEYSVLIKAEGFVSQEFNIAFECGKTVEKSVVMKKAEVECCNNILKMVIKDENGNPIKGARVWLRKNGVTKYEGTANESGLVAIDGICKGDYSALVKYEGYVAQEIAIGFDCEQTVDKTVVLKKAEVECCNNILKMVIKDESGNPIKGARVLLRRNGVTKYDGTANESGLAAIDGICKGEYSALVKYEGYVAQEIAIGFDCEQTVDKTVVLKKTEVECCNNMIKFNITDNEGNPLNNVQIKLTRGGAVKATMTTNGDGYASSDKNLCKGEYGVRIYREGYKVIEYEVNFDCEQTIEHTKKLTKNEVCCTAWAKVLPFDSETKAALNGAKVRIWKNGDLVNTLTVENGYVKFTNLCEGNYGFDIIYDGYKSIEWSAEIKCNYENIFEKAMNKE